MNDCTPFEELVASLPVCLGYVPNRALFVVKAFDGSGFEIPLDLKPGPATELATRLAATDDALFFASVGLIPVDLLQAVLPIFTAGPKFGAHAMIVIDSLTPGGSFTNLLTGETGRVLDWRTTEAAAEAATKGHVIFGSEDELKAMYKPVQPAVRRADGTHPLHECLAELERTICGNARPDAAKIGWLLTQNPETRRLALNKIDADPAAAHDVFASVGRVTRNRVRVEALTAAALSGYLNERPELVKRALFAAFDTAALIEPDWVPSFTWKLWDAFHSGVGPDEIKGVLFGDAA